MIITASMRTDIPAFYSDWFLNRVYAGYVDVLNPYSGDVPSYWRYQLNKDVVDVFSFCTKNPLPLIRNEKFKLFSRVYRQIWGMTITGYDRKVEENTLYTLDAIHAFRELSREVGSNAVMWRYDPIIFFDDKNNIPEHVAMFSYLAESLSGYTKKVIISFLDHYNKVNRNLPNGHRPNEDEQYELVYKLSQVTAMTGMSLYICHDNDVDFSDINVVTSGCFTLEEINKALDINLKRPSQSNARKGCDCVLNADIGAYNTCGHKCKYCYATNSHSIGYDKALRHSDSSSCIIGTVPENADIRNVKQSSWL